MKKLILPILAILFIMACTQESSDGIVPADGAIKFRSSGEKVDVCHNGHVIHVNVNALPDHLAHGDAIDSDGDGFFSGENDCDLPVDCNDDNPDLTESCCTESTWCDNSSGYELVIHFQEDCNATALYQADCNIMATWEYLGSNGNLSTYLENVGCGHNPNCTVLVYFNGDHITINYNCASDVIYAYPCTE